MVTAHRLFPPLAVIVRDPGELARAAAMVVVRKVAVPGVREGNLEGNRREVRRLAVLRREAVARRVRRSEKSTATGLMVTGPMATVRSDRVPLAVKTAPATALRPRVRLMATGRRQKVVVAQVVAQVAGHRGRVAMQVRAENRPGAVASDHADMKRRLSGRLRCNSVASRRALPL